jgi:hypothetical protein
MEAPQNQSLQLRSTVHQSLESVQKILNDNREKAHILTPFCRSKIPMIPPGWLVQTHLYTISTRSAQVNGKEVFPDEEVYRVPGSSKLALTKFGLWRLEQLAGVTWVNPETGKSTIETIHTGDPLVYTYSVIGYMRDINGEMRSQSDGYTLDLRDGSPSAIAYTDKQLPKARQNIAQVALTKAKLRALKGLLGIRQSYEPRELEKPFLIFKLAFDLESVMLGLDPATQKQILIAMVAKNMGLGSELFHLTDMGPTPTIQIDSSHNPQLPESAPEELPPPMDPESLPTGESAPDNDKDQAYWTARTARIDRIATLYLSKKGASRESISPNKPSLPNLNDDELAAIEEALSKLPDIQNLI